MEELPYDLYELITERLHGYKLKELTRLSKPIKEYTNHKLWSRLSKNWPEPVYQEYGYLVKQINYKYLQGNIRYIETYCENIKLLKINGYSAAWFDFVKRRGSLLKKIRKIILINTYFDGDANLYIRKKLYFKSLYISEEPNQKAGITVKGNGYHIDVRKFMEYYRLRKLPKLHLVNVNNVDEVYFDEKCQLSYLSSSYPISIQNIDYGCLNELYVYIPTQDFMTFAFNTFINLEKFSCYEYINPNVEKLTQKSLKLRHLRYSYNVEGVHYKNLYPSLDTLGLIRFEDWKYYLAMCPNLRVLMVSPETFGGFCPGRSVVYEGLILKPLPQNSSNKIGKLNSDHKIPTTIKTIVLSMDQYSDICNIKSFVELFPNVNVILRFDSECYSVFQHCLFGHRLPADFEKKEEDSELMEAINYFNTLDFKQEHYTVGAITNRKW